MNVRWRRVGISIFTHLTACMFGGSVVHFASEPASIVWGHFLGNEIHSHASFPGGHMARVYSAWGVGDQQLIFVVDGRRVYRTADFAPGNLDEKISWDASGKIVTFIALEKKIFTFNTETGIGTVESD